MDVETLRRQARELAGAGRLADAHKVYSMLYDDTCLRQGEAHPVALLLLNDLATVELRQGRFDAAQVLMQQGDIAAALTALYRAAASDDPVVASTAWARIGLALEDGGDTGGAADAYQKAMAGPAGDPATRSAIRLGALRRDQNDLDAAEQAYRSVFDCDDPEHRAIAQIGVAETRWAKGDKAAAATLYQEVVRTAPAPLAEHARVALRQLQGR